MLKTLSALALIGSVFATTASAHEPRVIVNEQFLGGQFNWDTRNYFVYRYMPVVLEGELHICGAFAGASSNRISNKFHRAAMEEASVRVNEDTVLRRLDYFRWHGGAALSNDLVGTEANCRGTGQMMSQLGGTKVEIRFREGRYSVER